MSRFDTENKDVTGRSRSRAGPDVPKCPKLSHPEKILNLRPVGGADRGRKVAPSFTSEKDSDPAGCQLGGPDRAVVRSGTRLTADLLDNPGKLRCVVRAGVGVDNIDVPAATRRGVIVMNTPSGNTVSAAEHTIALLLAVARHVPAADASMKAGKWDRGKFLGTQVAGKTLGVIGLGRIGREVARRAVGLDMKVIGFDPLVTPEKAAEFGIKAVGSKDELLPKCDFLTLHIPLLPDT